MKLITVTAGLCFVTWVRRTETLHLSLFKTKSIKINLNHLMTFFELNGFFPAD